MLHVRKVEERAGGIGLGVGGAALTRRDGRDGYAFEGHLDLLHPDIVDAVEILVTVVGLIQHIDGLESVRGHAVAASPGAIPVPIQRRCEACECDDHFRARGIAAPLDRAHQSRVIPVFGESEGEEAGRTGLRSNESRNDVGSRLDTPSGGRGDHLLEHETVHIVDGERRNVAVEV